MINQEKLEEAYERLSSYRSDGYEAMFPNNNASDDWELIFNAIRKLKVYKKALDKACKYIDDLTGDCPIEHDELMFEKNCEECTNCDNAISCWKEYLLKEAQNGK